MHPDTARLAAYLDGALGPDAQEELRSHVLACAHCSAALARLRTDERLIAGGVAGPVPDVRGAVRSRLRRRASGWTRAALAAGCLALLMLAALIAAPATTARYQAGRLLVLDRQPPGLLTLDPASGGVLGRQALDSAPAAIAYDPLADRLYLLTEAGVTALDPATLAPLERWLAPERWGGPAAIALDSRRGLLYTSWPEAGLVVRLDGRTLAETARFPAGRPGALALTPDGRRLFVADSGAGSLWDIRLPEGTAEARSLPETAGQRLWLAADGRWLHVLRGGQPPALLRFDWRGGQGTPALALAPGPSPQDLLLGPGWLAVARGDSKEGGVTIIDSHTGAEQQIDPGYDQHHLVAGPDGDLFGLNWLHRSVSHYQIGADTPVWRADLTDAMPWGGVYLPGRWRW